MVRLIAAVVLCLLTGSHAFGQEAASDLRTAAEKSDYKATARHEEVVKLLDALAASSPLARRADMGATHEGRTIPMLILADPPVANAEETRAAASKGRLVVLMLGNIHAGEVDGKEALPMLARDLLGEAKDGKESDLLKKLVLVFAPIYNGDGNERVDKKNRPGQNGPEEGMGVRENAQGLDLNRDFVKLEAPETRALAKFIRTWDPAVLVDTHTTNGSFHQYTLTYEGPRHPAGDPRIVEYVRDTFFPGVGKAVEEKHGWKTFFYGDFAADHTKWETYPAQPRYGTNYFGLRNRISVLTEGYSYSPFRDRVLATRDFVREVLNYLASNKEAVSKLLREADEESSKGAADAAPPERARRRRGGQQPEAAVTPPEEARPQADAKDAEKTKEEPTVAIRTKPVAAPEKATLLGFIEKSESGRAVSTGETKTYEVELWTRFESTLSVPRPFAYFYPAELTAITENLQRHGIEVDELREDIEVDAEFYKVEGLSKSRSFQGHELATVEVSTRKEPRRLNAGTILVRTGQKLGSLAAVLLEPQSEDGLATWNFFDASLSTGADFPVARIPAPTAIATGRVRTLAEDRPARKRITFEDAFESDRGINLSGSPAGIQRWVDKEHFLQFKDGKLRKVNAVSGRSEVVETNDAVAKALGTLPTIGERRARDMARGGSWSKERDGAFFSHENDLYYARADGSRAARLTSTPEDEELASFSPDGKFVAFVRSNDLFVVDVETATERRLTTTGCDHILNGKADWVYFEELFGRNWKVYWWSPDSQRLAFFESDNSMVPWYTLVDDLPEKQNVERVKYPRVGDANPRVRVGIVTAAGGSPQFPETPGYQPDNSLITGLGWWPDSSQAYFFVQDRSQTWLDFCVAPARGGAARKLFRDKTEAWIEAPSEPKFLKDGSFLVDSERTGYKHLYRYKADGTLIGAVTAGEWEIRSVPLVDEESGYVYFNAMKDSPIASNLYRAKLESASAAPADPERLTDERGSHSVSVSPDGGMFVDTWSSHESPTKIALRRGDGSTVRWLDTNPVYALEDFERGESSQFQIKSSYDGIDLEAALVKPVDFDPAKKYPVWITTYGGPHAPTVSDSWGGGQIWDHAMASAGVLVFHFDNHPSSGKGAKSAWTTYKRMGVRELADLKSAVDWLKSQPWVDGERIGLSGYSFGGYYTAYAMTHGDFLAAGIAGGSPTDWREYDTIYTERYMLTPQENPEGYDETSVVKGAANLKGKLMLVHGTMDDNVHPANSWKLARALQNAGKQFEMMMYPGWRHGIGGRQYQRMQYEFIMRTVGKTDGTDKAQSDN